MKSLGVIISLYLIYLVTTHPTEKVTYNGNQLWKITNDNKTTLKLLKTLAKEKYLTLWALNAKKVDAMIDHKYVTQVKEKLLENNQKYEVSIEDVQKAIDEANPKPQEDLDGRKGYRLTWNYYHNLDDIYDYLHYLEATFPKLCTVTTIGDSVEGRPIKLLRISNKNPNNKAVFVEGGIHAREWISPAAVTYIINQLISNYDDEPSYIKNLDWYFVPVLNPDGYTYTYNVDRLWRKNRAQSKTSDCVGVDLNRNWGYDWGSNGSSTDPCSNSYRGTKPFSEPETASVAKFFINNPDIQWVGYLAVHSYGQFIVYPWGDPNRIVEDYEDLNDAGIQAAERIIQGGGEPYTVGPVGIVLYKASGSSMDWAKGSAAIKFSFTLELRDRGQYGFILPAQFIKPSSEEALILVRVVAEAAAKTFTKK
ncbi:carboxypeptidase B-like [Zophobas morio]|uniref:carboxypeptidase B-like n=1 Tax=Zophobas morio TaxID=2755281 RepID=UPI003083B43D